MEDIIKTVEITSVFSISRLKGQKHLKLSKVLTSQGIEKRTVGYKGLQLPQKQDIKKSSNINVCYKRIHLSLTMSMSCMWLKVKLSCHSWNRQNGLGWDLEWGKKSKFESPACLKLQKVFRSLPPVENYTNQKRKHEFDYKCVKKR